MNIGSENPIVFLDIAVSNEKIGRVIIELFKDKVPKTAENFRALCTGEKGIGVNGKPLHYKGCYFHKLVSSLMVQGGDIINFDGTGGESIYGPHFEDEDLKSLHTVEGLLSMVNEGEPNTNSSQFVITMASCPQLNSTNVIFGQVLKGLGTVKELNEIPNINDKPIEKCTIIDCGELSSRDDWGLEDNDGEDIYTPYPEDWNNISNEIDYQEVLDAVKRIKSVGNDYFSKERYSTAEKKYKKALRYYEFMMKIKGVPNNDTSITDLKIIMILNLAASKLNQFKYREVLDLCNNVLATGKYTSKALFRRGQAHMGLNEYQLGLDDFKKANEVNPTNKEILKEIDRAKEALKSYLITEREACKRMFKTN